MYSKSIPKCRDPRGKLDCFAAQSGGRCRCLGDTSKTPCPFYKTVEQVLEEDPDYFNRDGFGRVKK